MTIAGVNHADVVRQLMEAVQEEELAAELLFRVSGIDMNTDHNRDTPKRFVAMLREMNTPEPFKFTTFPNEDSREMVVIKNIPFYTLCQHHVVPFFGVAHVGYIPNERLAGLSKFARLVRNMAKGMWVQENLTTQIAQSIEETLDPIGTAVVIEAEHMCMTMRGVQVPGSKTMTSAMYGAFEDHTKLARQEFFELIRKG